VFLPLGATGIVIYKVGDQPAVVGGSCGAYLARHIYVTASHCIPEQADAAFVSMPGEPGRRIIGIDRHETADIAVLVGERFDDEPMSSQVYLRTGLNDLPFGGDFVTFGYPDGAPESNPVGRLMKGHFQRYFGYSPVRGGSYFAGEMSIPAPAGMSGAPVCWAMRPQELIGVVTTNHDSYTIIDSIAEVDSNGKSYKETNRRMVSYGIAAMLSGLEEWLDGACAPHL
jgi:hypothetical protein